MDDFFEKTVVLHKFKDLFIAAHVKNEDFFNLKTETIVNILKGDMSAVALFLPLYQVEKYNYVENQDLNLNDRSNNDLNMSWSEEVIEVLNEVPQQFSCIVPLNANIQTKDVEIEIENNIQEINDIETTDEVESSTHSVPENFEFIQNSLFFALKDTIEGRIILGMYKNSNILLESRLKKFIIQKLIVENSVTYKINRTRFEEITSDILQLFPTIQPDDWYKKYHRNVHGQEVCACGCLVNCYKTYRKDLALAGILKYSTKPENSEFTEKDAVPDIDLKPLTDTNRSEYLIGTVLDTWVKSFDRRQNELVLKKNKKIIIRYETYLNTFVCLNSSFGLQLLETDSDLIIQNLAKNSAITTKVAQNFNNIFYTRWNTLAESVCKFGNVSQIAVIKEFRETHKTYINNVPKSILALFYAAYFLIKATSIDTKGKGTYTFSRIECVEHFIKIVENESLVEEYKLNLKKKLNELGLPVSPYIIFCGKLDSITKAFVALDDIHYEIKDPLKAVASCLKISVALHTWPLTCANVWQYLLEHVYSIRPNTSHVFPPSKSTKTISSFIKKVDPTFTTSETTD